MLYQYVFDPCVEINQTRTTLTTIIKGSHNKPDVQKNIDKMRMNANTILKKKRMIVLLNPSKIRCREVFQ